MVLSTNYFFSGISITVLTYSVASTCQTVTQKINDLGKSLILDKTVTNCIHQTVVDGKYDRSKRYLEILSDSVDKLKYEVLEPLGTLETNRKTTENKDLPTDENYSNYLDIYNDFKNVIDSVKSIQCKKKIKKKGVLKKIKKYMTTEEPEAVKEEKEILQSYEDFDGWTHEHLQLMKQYYKEIQQLLGEIRDLCPY